MSRYRCIRMRHKKSRIADGRQKKRLNAFDRPGERFCGFSAEQLELYSGLLRKYPEVFSMLKEHDRNFFEEGITFALRHLKVSFESELKNDIVSIKQHLGLSKINNNDIDAALNGFLAYLRAE